jgi:hypothetical protein
MYFGKAYRERVASLLIHRSTTAYAQTHDASNIILKMKLSLVEKERIVMELTVMPIMYVVAFYKSRVSAYGPAVLTPTSE